MLTTSARANTSRTQVQRAIPRHAARSSVREGEYPTMLMPNARRNISAARRAMLPTPTRPSVLPCSSMPVSRDRYGEGFAGLQHAVRQIYTRSAPERGAVPTTSSRHRLRVFARGHSTTRTPRCAAAARSTLSVPVPCMPMTFKAGHCSRKAASMRRFRLMAASARPRTGGVRKKPQPWFVSSASARGWERVHTKIFSAYSLPGYGVWYVRCPAGQRQAFLSFQASSLSAVA